MTDAEFDLAAAVTWDQIMRAMRDLSLATRDNVFFPQVVEWRSAPLKDGGRLHARLVAFASDADAPKPPPGLAISFRVDGRCLVVRCDCTAGLVAHGGH